MTQLNPTNAARTGLTDPSRLSGPGIANLSALSALTGLSALGAANLSTLTGPGGTDLTEPNRVSAVDEHDGVRLGPSFGGLPGGSPVRETPNEPPPANHLAAQVSPADRPTRDRGD
jgi:hypothetical protein